MIALKDIKSNPFRHIDRYPVNRTKVEQLKRSIQATSFWDNLVARRLPDGTAQIAYGHHRLIALREMFDAGHKIGLIIRDLDDATMLRIMANENMQEWAASATVDHETVQAVVTAYAAGQIKLTSVAPNVPAMQVRVAPSFLLGRRGAPAGGSHDYTSDTVAAFLGWGPHKVQDALGALELIEEGLTTEKQFEGLGPQQAATVVTETRRAKRAREDAARKAEESALEAQTRAEEAEKRRQQAEIVRRQAEQKIMVAESERRRQEEIAQAARDKEAKVHAQEAAEAARRRVKRAEQEKQAAETSAANAHQEHQQQLTQHKKSTAQAAAEKAQAVKDARAVSSKLSDGFRSETVTRRTAKQAAQSVIARQPANKLIQLERFVEQLTLAVEGILVRGDKLFVGINTALPELDNLPLSYRRSLATALRKLALRAAATAEKIHRRPMQPQENYGCEACSFNSTTGCALRLPNDGQTCKEWDWNEKTQ